MDTKSFRLLGVAIAGVTVFVVASCGKSSNNVGGGSGRPTGQVPDPTVVPLSAGASGTAFTSYVQSLPADETTTEPKTFAVGFADPAENGDEPIPAS